MTQEKDQARVFFAASVVAPWPENFPKGRVIDAKNRHMTLVFLGGIDRQTIHKDLFHFPKPEFQIGPVGKFVNCIFLPHQNPNVVSYEMDFIDKNHLLEKYQERIFSWLKEKNISLKKEKRKFYPHMTISRGAFVLQDWKKSFSPFPFLISGIHLYESLGDSNYKILSSHSLIFPFEEMHHTADLAYLVRGEDMQSIHRNAEIALAFSFPPLVEFLDENRTCSSIEEIVTDLNQHVSKADAQYGCTFKAVSFHGQLQQTKKGMFQWEMIIDV